MLGPFSSVPPPADEKGRKVARAVARPALVIIAVKLLLSVARAPLGGPPTRTLA